MPNTPPEAQVTVIIPAKNRQALLIRSVESILKQPVLSRIVIIDDGSDIPLSIKSKTHPNRIKIIRLPHSRGPANARNIGLKFVSTPFVAFLDSDDYWQPDFLPSALGFLLHRPDCAAVMTLMRLVFEPGMSFFSKIRLLLFNVLKEASLGLFFYFNSGNVPRSFVYLCQVSQTIYNASFLRNLRFDVRYKFCEDWKFTFEVTRYGNLAILPRRLINYSYSQSSNTFVQIRQAHQDKKKYYDLLSSTMRRELGITLGVLLFDIYSKIFLVKSI